MPKSLLESIDISLPNLPLSQDGLRIAHITDLHMTRPKHWLERILRQLAGRKIDMVVLTGDYMTRFCAMKPAMDMLTFLTTTVQPRLGFYGVFGNHDNSEFRQVARELPIRWLVNERTHIPHTELELIGLDEKFMSYEQSDLVPLATQAPLESASAKCKIALAHSPHMAVPLSELNVSFVMSGHTHGGQVRLPNCRTFKHCELPSSQSAGLMRHRDTTIAVSRGLGNRRYTFRIFCPYQLPIYTLRHGQRFGQYTDSLVNISPW